VQNLIDSYQPTITFFDEFKDMQEMLGPLKELSKSEVFKAIWTEYCRLMPDHSRSVHNLPVNLEWCEVVYEEPPSNEIVTNIWNPSFARWRKLCQEFKKGSITISTTDDIFGPFGKNYDVIEVEVNLMCQDLELSKLRVEQIRSHHESCRYLRGTKVILRAKDTLKLKGDFSALEALQNVVSVFLRFY